MESNTSTKGKRNITDLADRFAIKNFVLSDFSQIPVDQSLEEPFLFNGFVFIICLKGEVRFRLNYREYIIMADSICTTMPNQIFQLVNRSEDLIVETLYLSADYVLELPLLKDFDLLRNMNDDPVRQVNVQTKQNILELHSLITKYHRLGNNIYRKSQTKALIFAMLMEIGSVYSTPSLEISQVVSHQQRLADDFFTLLLENYRTERSVAFYAGKLCLTPKHLTTLVKKVTGHPISNWINEAVIIEAKRMLKITDLTVLQISEELNFPNPSFFGRFFKRHTDMTPLQYKNGEESLGRI